MHPKLNHQFFEHHGGAAAPPTPPALFVCFLLGLKCPPVPVNPPATFLDFVTHNLLVMLGMLVGHAGDVENDAGDVEELV